MKNIYIILSFLLSLNSFSIEHTVKFDKELFKVLSYSSINPNEFKFRVKDLFIKVKGSASPLIYPLKDPKTFKELSFKAKLKGRVNYKGAQGEKGSDDFSLRVGVVYEGDKTLNFFQKAIAAKWIVTLFELAPNGTGVSEINFFNTFQDKKLKDKSREHPLSDLLVENFVSDVSNSDMIDVKVPLDKNKKILALWISSDGDDTSSNFEVVLNEIKLKE